jgi:magnesium-transporting ATPase (P-type)
MSYIAVTAVEDKLQDRVPESIKFMREAGIGLWVLTGDKRETAENIGYSANLLDRDMNVVHIQAGTGEELAAQLDDARRRYTGAAAARRGGGKRIDERELLASPSTSDDEGEGEGEGGDAVFPFASRMRLDTGNSEGGGTTLLRKASSRMRSATSFLSSSGRKAHAREGQAELAIIIDGASLAHAIEDHPDEFMDLADYCKTVICCRVTPLQKALVVRMVREMRQAMTLAIGDGGNDVSMIQEAHVGVGLFGKEGTQAARAGDYAMSEFKHLQRLLSVHGRYSYVRTSGVINLSFYKNILFTATQVLFQIFNFVSGTTFQDQWVVSSFNVVVTAASPFLFGIFERDLDESTLARFPQVYASNRGDRLFSLRSVAEYTFLYGLWHAVCVFFGTFFGMGYLTIPFADGRDGGFYMTGLASALMIVIITLLKFTLHSHLLNWLIIAALVLSFAIFFCVIPMAITIVGEYPLEGVLTMMLSSPQFYLTALLVVGACFFVDFAVLVTRQLLYPDVVATLQRWEAENHRQIRRERKGKGGGGAGDGLAA